MTHQPPESRDVSLGPGIPRVTLEPLDLPAAEPSEVCPECLGGGPDEDGFDCPCCGGSGRQNGGAA